MTADFIAHALNARRSGTAWVANCPAHDDRNPSLSIRDTDGKVLVHCHAGCSQKDVIAALNALGLWEIPPTSTHRTIVTTYGYTDEAGVLLYEVVRYRPKGFHQRRPDGRGGWIWKRAERQVLYHLPEVLEAPIVFVVEGEKDADNLRDHGFVTTTNSGGADAPWLESFSRALADREVILIPDNDEPGKKRVLRIAQALVGYATRIVILELEGVKDVSEWLAQGHSELELISLVEADGVAP